MDLLKACPLCTTDASINLMAIPDRDLASVQCPACGFYWVDEILLIQLSKLDWTTRSRISMATRQGSDAGKKVTITDASLEEVSKRVVLPSTIGEKVDRLIQLLGERAGTNYLQVIPCNRATDWPLIGVRAPHEVDAVRTFASVLEYVRHDHNVLTLKGVQRYEQLRVSNQNSRRAFVAMWFDAELTPVWVQGLKAGIERSTYFTAYRIDGVEHNDRIDDRIIAEIRRSGLVVADFTGHRNGVYFEAGFAMGLGIPVSWTCRRNELSKAHFDTRQYNHVLWDDASELADGLDARIRALHVPVGWDV